MVPSQNELIQAAAWLAARGRLANIPRHGGSCLQLVRLVVEAALGLRSHEMYDRWLIAGTSKRGGAAPERAAAARQNPWASDMEASAKQLDWGVPFHARQAGDLLFNWRALEPYGHVAVLFDQNTILENIDLAVRPNSIHIGPALALTPVDALPWTLVARVPPVQGEGGGPILG